MSATTTTTAAPATVASKAAEWGAVIISLFALSIFLAAIVVAMQTKDPSLGILLGAASANATTAVGFWLGSSKGSQAKDSALIAQVVPPAGSTTTTTTQPTGPTGPTGATGS